MREFTIADKSYNNETGELEQFLVFWSGGEPELKTASVENILLFDPEDELPFDGGMYEFLNGETALILSEDPEVIVAPTKNEYAFMIRVRGNVVETTAQQAEQVLQGVLDVSNGDEPNDIIALYHTIMDEQVRQDLVSSLYGTFDEADRIKKMSNGWLIDDFYLVDWTASVYTKDDDPQEDDYIRQGSSVKKDGSYEFVKLSINRVARDIDPVSVRISDDTYQLSEREMLFLAKVKWLLSRRHYHPDQPFWMTADQHASVDPETGKPISDEPSTDTFNL